MVSYLGFSDLSNMQVVATSQTKQKAARFFIQTLELPIALQRFDHIGIEPDISLMIQTSIT